VLANWDDWGFGDVDWLAADVVERCKEATRAWGLSRLRPLAGGEVALVLAVRAPTGEAVLKLGPRPPGCPPSLEGEGLSVWAERGAAPRLLGTRDDGHTLLLERIHPGRTLRETGASGSEIVETIGTLCRALHSAEPPARFPSLADHAHTDGWFAALAGTPEHDVLTRLTTSADGGRLLHIDLHWLNALQGPDGWLAIDPKPCVGDPCADVWAFFDGPPRREIPDRPQSARTYLHGLIDAYARASGLDRARLASWIHIRALITLRQGDPSATRDRGLTELARAPGVER
jgi:streptomycin 6-kinase